MMLRTAENVRLSFDPMPDGQGWLVLDLDGEEIRLRRTNPLEYRRILRLTLADPFPVAVLSESALWLYREEYLWSDVDLTQSEVRQEMAWSLPTG